MTDAADLIPALPDITDDLGTAIEHIRAYGCARLAGALSEEEVGELRETIHAEAAKDLADDNDHIYSDGSNQRVWALFNRGESFLKLAEHPTALALMESCLGPDVRMSNLSANITGPGGGAMTPHWDQDWAARPWPQALAAHVIWVVDEFTEENGATLVAPGSHLLDGPPPEGSMVPATGPAGTALVIDGRIWHGTGAKRSAGSARTGVLAYYCRPYIRQQENFQLSMAPSVLESLSPARRDFFGFGFYEYLNMISGPPRDLDRY
ncbi:phytanoyl-CoA dioxygenase family protein [Streptomyces sp. NPDC056010]|uniref:phytanoyl-CoA dioxygenase family protein n=1 Tax=Streptomyces sp. NPDC056010 TaxID=3345679 RepID=UPI0035E041CE